jgi:hypothetical protein
MALTTRDIARLTRRINIDKAFVPRLFWRPNRSIFDNLECVFVHVPKTAGTSIRKAFERFPDPSPRRYPRLRSHARAFEYRLALGEERWNRYFSFAFVRNPWDLMVSSYFWWREKAHLYRRTRRSRRKILAMADFNEFVRSPVGREQINEFKGDIFDWISSDGEIIVDHVGRMETLSDDWRVICREIGVPAPELPSSNITSRGDYRDYYDEGSIELVAERFHRTIDRFGYEF